MTDEQLRQARLVVGDVGIERIDEELARRAHGENGGTTRTRMVPGPEQPPAGAREVRQGHQPGVMNGIEKRYATMCEAERRTGQIAAWGFEELAFRIGVTRCWYRPDFWKRHNDGHLELVECKGAFRPGTGAAAKSRVEVHTEGRVKFEAAAQHFPMFEWTKVTWRDGAFYALANYPVRGAALAAGG